MPSRKIEPAFDPKTNIWYVEIAEGMTAEAPTLRQLKIAVQRAIGGGVRIDGYYPRGYQAIRQI